MKYLSSKTLALNTIFSIVGLVPLFFPIVVLLIGLNIAKSGKTPQNFILKSIVNETRELYFRLNLRNTIQFDSNCFEISRSLIYQPKKNVSCIQDNLTFFGTLTSTYAFCPGKSFVWDPQGYVNRTWTHRFCLTVSRRHLSLKKSNCLDLPHRKCLD